MPASRRSWSARAPTSRDRRPGGILLARRRRRGHRLRGRPARRMSACAGSPLGDRDRVLGGSSAAARRSSSSGSPAGCSRAGPLRDLATQAQTSLVVRSHDRVLPPPTEIAARAGRSPRRHRDAEPLHRARAAARRAGPDPDRPRGRGDRAARREQHGPVSARRASSRRPAPASRSIARTSSRTPMCRGRAGDPRRDRRAASPTRRHGRLRQPGARRRAAPGPGPGASPLRFASADPERGAIGATLGYPRAARSRSRRPPSPDRTWPRVATSTASSASAG